jgi:hypothetical protein
MTFEITPFDLSRTSTEEATNFDSRSGCERAASKLLSLLRGTEGSDPAPSGGESVSHVNFVGSIERTFGRAGTCSTYCFLVCFYNAAVAGAGLNASCSCEMSRFV